MVDINHHTVTKAVARYEIQKYKMKVTNFAVSVINFSLTQRYTTVNVKMKIDTFVLSSDKHFIDSPRKSVFLLLLSFSIT